MRYTKLLYIIPFLLILFLGCDFNSTVVSDPSTYNSYHILNNTNSHLLSKLATYEHVKADSVFSLPAGLRIKLFDHWELGSFPLTPREAIKRIALFHDSTGTLNQVYLQDPINNSLWKRASKNSYYDYTLEINEDDIE